MAKAFKHIEKYLQQEVAKSLKNRIMIIVLLTVTEQANYLSNKVQTSYLSAKWL